MLSDKSFQRTKDINDKLVCCETGKENIGAAGISLFSAKISSKV